MYPDELSMLLAYINAIDRRFAYGTTKEEKQAQKRAWADLLPNNLKYADAKQGVANFYKTHERSISPAALIKEIETIQHQQRLQAQRQLTPARDGVPMPERVKQRLDLLLQDWARKPKLKKGKQ